jgi:hypothetical protein
MPRSDLLMPLLVCAVKFLFLPVLLKFYEPLMKQREGYIGRKVTKLKILSVTRRHNMGEIRSWEADSRGSGRYTPRLLWNLKFYYRVHKSLPLVPILSQMHPVHTRLVFKNTFNIVLLSTLRSSKRTFHSDFSTKILYSFLHACYMPLTSYIP